MRKIFTLFLISCFVNLILCTTVYSVSFDGKIPYGGNLLLNEQYHDIDIKCFEHGKDDEHPVPINDISKYNTKAILLKQKINDLLDSLHKEEDVKKIKYGAVFFFFGYPNNLEIVFVSENKIELKYSRKIKIEDSFLKENLRRAAISMNIVDTDQGYKRNYSVVMELFSKNDLKENVKPNYTLKKINPWIANYIIIIIIIIIIILPTPMGDGEIPPPVIPPIDPPRPPISRE